MVCWHHFRETSSVLVDDGKRRPWPQKCSPSLEQMGLHLKPKESQCVGLTLSDYSQVRRWPHSDTRRLHPQSDCMTDRWPPGSHSASAPRPDDARHHGSHGYCRQWNKIRALYTGAQCNNMYAHTHTHAHIHMHITAQYSSFILKNILGLFVFFLNKNIATNSIR